MRYPVRWSKENRWVFSLVLYVIVPVFGKYNADLTARSEKSVVPADLNPDSAAMLPAGNTSEDQYRFAADLIRSGKTLFEAGVYSEASEKLREAERYLPGFPDKHVISSVYHYLGRLAWIEKKVGAAERYFQQAFEIA